MENDRAFVLLLYYDWM